jgi:hypothetical protein
MDKLIRTSIKKRPNGWLVIKILYAYTVKFISIPIATEI